MPPTLPDYWAQNPPHSLIVGGGAYALALAAICGAGFLSLDATEGEPTSSPNGASPRLLNELRHVFMVLDDNASTSNALCSHRNVWRWIGRLTSAGDQHEIAFVFVLPEHASPDSERALATGLCVSVVNPASAGLGFWRRSGSLFELSLLVASIQPKDLLVLRARQTRDVRYAAINKLRAAVAIGDQAAATGAAQEVCGVFKDQEGDLDIFCRPPSHSHGHLLRRWLLTTVTGSVTSDWNNVNQQLHLWLL